jgi:pimeloyl-ACP methyl ester carboxylesterase
MGPLGDCNPKPRDTQTAGRRQYLENGQREAAALLFQPCGMHRPGSVKERQAARAGIKEDIVTEPTSHTLEVPGAVLTYDVRPNDSSTQPVLLLIGSPMGASGFPTLAGHFADRTVVTYDPRGVERSTRTDGAIESTPEMHADDLFRLISALNAGPVDIFASSGGAINALALVARHPEQVRTLVAHEPPAAQVLPDREAALAANADIHETYLRRGFGPAMAKFLVLVGHKGPVPADLFGGQGPDPAMFGLPTEDDGSRDDPLLGQNIVSSTHYEPDFDALRSASTRIVIAAGTESEGELAHRGAIAVAERLGTTPVMFPSGHGGFLGDEYGMPGEPEAFASTLREVLTAQA